MLAQADPSAATTPQRLAGRCLPQSGSALVRGCGAWQGAHAPAEKTMGLLSLFCSSGYVVTQTKVRTPQNAVTHPHSGQAHHGHFPPTLAVAPSAKATTNPDRSRKKRMKRYSSLWVQQALWAWPTPPHKLPHPVPRAAEAPQAPQLPPALAGSPAAEQHLGLLLPRTQASSAAPARAQPFPRHRQPQKGNNVNWNSTYSGSLLHNNRHLTQGSPDFTDSKKGERRQRRKGESEGWGRQSQTSISDRSAERPRAATASEVKCFQS